MASRINCDQIVLVCFIFYVLQYMGGKCVTFSGLSYQSSFIIQINRKLDYHLRILA
jgi:hypothetical protein